jgi:hypothetical protein
LDRLFYNAIRAKYPDIKFVADGWDDFGDSSPTWWTTIITTRPNGSCATPNQYDKTDRNGPKVFVGEYAVTKTAAWAICAAPLAKRPS